MAVLPLIIAPDNRLRRKAIYVSFVNSNLKDLMYDMADTMYSFGGVGLAATQVGINKSLLVIDLKNITDTDNLLINYPLFIFNPIVIKKSDELVTSFEGCLSLPYQLINVLRSNTIIIEYLDINNKKNILEAKGFLSRVIQHELDHLDGKLLIDYLSFIKRDIILRKLKKIKCSKL